MRSSVAYASILATLVAGCTDTTRKRIPRGPDRTQTTEVDTGLDTGTPSTDTDTPTGSTTTDDCVIPPAPTTWDYLVWVPPSEEFHFDAVGNLTNIDEVAGWLFETPWGGPPNLTAPYNADEIAAVRFLLDGDLAVADEANGALRRVGLDGSQSTILGGLNNPNSMAIHTDGFVFVTAFDTIYRVDPASGASTAVLRVPGADLDGLVFSPDFTKLYFNSDETGQVMSATIDVYGVAGPIENEAALALGWYDQLDGQAMDSCGNLYVIRTDGRLFRVRPNGNIETLIELTHPGQVSTTSLHFGSGVGGWELDHLYVMNREGGVFDLAIGIDGAPPAHLF